MKKLLLGVAAATGAMAAMMYAVEPVVTDICTVRLILPAGVFGPFESAIDNLLGLVAADDAIRIVVPAPAVAELSSSEPVNCTGHALFATVVTVPTTSALVSAVPLLCASGYPL